jgi:hypothetical protein
VKSDRCRPAVGKGKASHRETETRTSALEMQESGKTHGDRTHPDSEMRRAHVRRW